MSARYKSVIVTFCSCAKLFQQTWKTCPSTPQFKENSLSIQRVLGLHLQFSSARVIQYLPFKAIEDSILSLFSAAFHESHTLFLSKLCVCSTKINKGVSLRNHLQHKVPHQSTVCWITDRIHRLVCTCKAFPARHVICLSLSPDGDRTWNHELPSLVPVLGHSYSCRPRNKSHYKAFSSHGIPWLFC